MHNHAKPKQRHGYLNKKEWKLWPHCCQPRSNYGVEWWIILYSISLNDHVHKFVTKPD